MEWLALDKKRHTRNQLENNFIGYAKFNYSLLYLFTFRPTISHARTYLIVTKTIRKSPLIGKIVWNFVPVIITENIEL